MRSEWIARDGDWLLEEMIWADHYGNQATKEELVCKVNDIIEELPWTWTWSLSRSRCGGRAPTKMKTVGR